MSKEYRKQTENKYKERIREDLALLPSFVADYNRHINLSTEASTRALYVSDIRQFLEYVSKKLEIDVKDITTDDLEGLSTKFIEEYFIDSKDGKGENNNTSIKRIQTAIRNLYNYLYQMDEIEVNPTLKLETPKLKQKAITKLDDDEIRQFLNKVKYGDNYTGERKKYHNRYGVRDYTIITLLLGTGLRISECVGLNIQDINLKNHSLNVIRKGNKEDTVYYSDELTEILRDYIYIYRKPIVPVEGHEDALFFSAQRKRMGVRSIEKMIENYALESEVGKHVTPHLLRRSFGTKLYNQTGDLYLVSSTLGHTSVETTRRSYAAITEQHKIENRNAISLDE